MVTSFSLLIRFTQLCTGSEEGSLNAANILKPVLTREKFPVLTATTVKQCYLFEKDAALARRFQRVNVDEPDLDDMVEVLKYTKDPFEQFHELTVPDELVRDLVNLSATFVKDRYFPDKAFDLLDEKLRQYFIERRRITNDPTYLSVIAS